MAKSKMLTLKQKTELLELLKDRFLKNTIRHPELFWDYIQIKLEASPEKLLTLQKMELTGGEPDVVGFDDNTGEYIFYDCSKETPIGRRSVCYDNEALESRKKNKPENSALGMAVDMGIEILTEEQYRKLQEMGDYDTKTSSWILTPARIRKLGGALFCDRRYDTVFLYHNGAESYYSVRGFRGSLRV